MTTTCRLTDDWLPLPASVLAATGWGEGDLITLEVIEGVMLATRTGRAPTTHTPPARTDRWKRELNTGGLQAP